MFPLFGLSMWSEDLELNPLISPCTFLLSPVKMALVHTCVVYYTSVLQAQRFSLWPFGNLKLCRQT